MTLPLVFVPGLVGTAELFAAQMVALWPHASVMCASTVRGASMAEIAEAVLRDAPPRFALAGISMGGYLAFEILRQARDRVGKLALLDTSPRPDAPEQTKNRRALMAAADGPDFEAKLRPVFASLLHPSHRGDERLVETQLRMARTVGRDAFKRQEEAIIARPDSRPLLPTIAVPTLVLVGDADAVTPPDIAREMARAIRDAKLVVVETAGHATTLEQPGAVSEALAAWLTS